MRKVLVLLAVLAAFSGALHAQVLGDVTAFSQDWAAVSPHNTNELTRQPRALFICDDGDDTVETGTLSAIGWNDTGSTPATFFLTEGNLYPISPRLIRATGTTLSCIIALY